VIKGLLFAAAVPAILAVTSADVAASDAAGAPAGHGRQEAGAKANPSARNSEHGSEERSRNQDRKREHEDGSRERGQGDHDTAEAPKVRLTPSTGPSSIPEPLPASPAASSAFTPTPIPQTSIPQTSIRATPVLGPISLPTGLEVAIGQEGATVVVPAIGAPPRPPISALTPRDPERSPQAPVLADVQPAVPAALAAALAALPLLLVIWAAAFLRLAATLRRRLTARTHLALAAELGIAPLRLAGLLPRELAVLRDKVAFDELTGIMRRAGGLATLDREISRARRRQTPLSIAFIDVDGLKAVNDARGHAAGDALLKDTAQVLGGRLRAEDAIFRYGGDEFCCVLPDADEVAAKRIFDEALVAARARGGSFSVGLAQLADDDDRASLLARADADLYRGRAARGNGGRA